MKFSVSVALFYLATGAYSAVAAPPPSRVARDPPSIVDRDVATATSVLAVVKTGFNSLSDATKAFSGDIGPVKSSADDLIGNVESGTESISKMTALNVFECLSLLGPAQDLSKQGQALADQIKAKKPDFEKAKQCTTVHDFLSRGTDDSAKLITALVGKVPDSVKGTVQSEGDKVTNTLKDARDAFAPGSCTDAA